MIDQACYKVAGCWTSCFDGPSVHLRFEKWLKYPAVLQTCLLMDLLYMIVRISSCGNTADNPSGNLNLLAEVKI